ncbi:MAG: hypothetical protein K5873_10535 [Treponema sp.]|nr:hypothetical protein [Treponema sp.]
MFKYTKYIFFSILILFFFSPVFSQSEDSGEAAVFIEVVESEKSSTEDESEEVADDFDSLFENAEDTDEAVKTEEEEVGTNYKIQVGKLKFPIEVSGKLNTEFGAAFLREDEANEGTLYFDFKNYIYFITRPDKYLALKGTLKTTMPKDSSDTTYEQNNHLFYLYEMYFDYLAFDRIYITAGKKKSVWGNVRLFSDYYDTSENITNTDSNTVSDSNDDNVNDAKYTNILYDSREYISGIIKVPFGNHTLTALAMYNDETNVTSTKTENMSIAGNVEFIFLNTSLNIFGRRFKLKDSDNDSDRTQLPIIGMELKKTIFGFDAYGQSLVRIKDGSKTWDFFSSGFEDKSAFSRVVSTIGTYRLWSDSMPYVGFNIEFQNIYRPYPSDSQDRYVNRFAIQFGMAKLGPDKNIKPAIQWNHNINDNSGFIKAGVIFGGVLPHCDWRIGGKYEYGKVTTDESGEAHNYSKLTLGTYITISLDY